MIFNSFLMLVIYFQLETRIKMTTIEVGNTTGDTAVVSGPIKVNDAMAKLAIYGYKKSKGLRDPIDTFALYFQNNRFPYVMVWSKLHTLDLLGELKVPQVKAYLAGLEVDEVVEGFSGGGCTEGYTPLGVSADAEVVAIKKEMTQCQQTIAKIIIQQKLSMTMP